MRVTQLVRDALIASFCLSLLGGSEDPIISTSWFSLFIPSKVRRSSGNKEQKVKKRKKIIKVIHTPFLSLITS